MLAVYLENGRVETRDVAVPARPRGFALIRLLRAGICNTDLELLRGYYGFGGIPGHEFVGEVIEADTPGLAGRRVTGEINLACGACAWCREGLGRHCPNRAVLGIVRHPGAFAEFLTLPESNLHALPDSIPTESAVFVEPLAAACEILDQVSPPPGAPIAVLGKGKLGLLIARVLEARGFRVCLLGRRDEKPPASFDWVVEATGSAQGFQEALEMARPRGTLIMKSTIHEKIPIDTAPLIVNEIALIGSRCGRFEPAIELLRTGAVAVEPMISARYPLAEAAAAFEHAARAGTLKVLLTPDGASTTPPAPTPTPPR